MRVAVFFFTMKRCRVLLVLITWFSLFNGYLPFRRLFAVGLFRDNGNVPDLLQKLAYHRLCRYPNIFGRIGEVFSGPRVSKVAVVA